MSTALRRLACGLSVLALLACQDRTAQATETAPFTTHTLISGLDQPWGLAFLPDGDLLITEKTGALRRWDGARLHAVSGTPNSVAAGQGGLLDVALHPRFGEDPTQRWVYLSYSFETEGGYGTALGRGRLDDDRLTDWQDLFTLPHASGKGQHFGSRIAFDEQGHLFFSIGDRGERQRAQDLGDPAGSILRLTLDGDIPGDNPYVNRSGAHPAIYSHGHRNPQGLARHPVSGSLWAHEHGPQGGDEVNRIVAGRNYGWPVITYGEEYGSGRAIGEGTAKPGMEQPLYMWKPSIAPSGMAFYRGEPFADWNGDLLVGALKARVLVRLKMQDGRILSEHRYVPDEASRIRDVRVGPDGLVYLLTDARDGQLLRLSPR